MIKSYIYRLFINKATRKTKPFKASIRTQCIRPSVRTHRTPNTGKSKALQHYPTTRLNHRSATKHHIFVNGQNYSYLCREELIIVDPTRDQTYNSHKKNGPKPAKVYSPFIVVYTFRFSNPSRYTYVTI